MSKFSEIMTGYKIYENETDYYGAGDVELPKIVEITEEMSGAGVSGKYKATVTGALESMEMSINMRNPTSDGARLYEAREHTLTIRVNIQERDTVKGVRQLGIKYVVKFEPYSYEPGKVANYSTGDSKITGAVTYFAQYIDGKETLVADPFNYIYRVNGVDYMADIRKNLGM